MGVVNQEAIKQFESLMEEVDEPLKIAFENMHHGYQTETLSRFLKARDGNVAKAHKMLVDCLNWRIQNEIDNILSKPIIPSESHRAVRDSQLVGLSGYSKEGHAIGVGLSTFDKASVRTPEDILNANRLIFPGVGAFAPAMDVTLLDYGAGNVRSVRNAIRYLGFIIKDVQTREEILNADRLIFPGAGAFAPAMDVLNQKGKKAMDTSTNGSEVSFKTGDILEVVIQDCSSCKEPQEIQSSRIEDLRKRVLKMEEQILLKLAGDMRNSVHDSSSLIVKRKEALEKTISKQDARLLGLATMFVGVEGLLMAGVLQQSNLKCRTCYIPMSVTLFSSIGFLIGMWHSVKKYMTSLQTMQRIQSQQELGNRGEGIPTPEGSPTNYWSKEEEEFGPVAHRQRVIQFRIAGFVMIACTAIVMLACPLVYCTQ